MKRFLSGVGFRMRLHQSDDLETVGKAPPKIALFGFGPRRGKNVLRVDNDITLSHKSESPRLRHQTGSLVGDPRSPALVPRSYQPASLRITVLFRLGAGD